MGKRKTTGGWTGGLTNVIMVLKGACIKHDLPTMPNSPYIMGERIIKALKLSLDPELTKQKRIVWLYQHLVEAGYKRAPYATGKKWKPSDFGPAIPKPPSKKDRQDAKATGEMNSILRAAGVKTDHGSRVRTRAEKDAFYDTWEWKTLRMQAFQRDGRVCACCGSTPADGVRLVVDHIKPLGEFWGLRLSLANMQILCNDCNMGKGNWLHKDFREVAEPEDEDYLTAQFKDTMRH